MRRFAEVFEELMMAVCFAEAGVDLNGKDLSAGVIRPCPGAGERPGSPFCPVNDTRN